MPEKRFNSRAIIYSSDEDGLGAYLCGEHEHDITEVKIPPSLTKGAMVGDVVDVCVYIKSPRRRQRAAFVSAYTSRVKYKNIDSTQGYAAVQSIISPLEFSVAGRLEEGASHMLFIANPGVNIRASIYQVDLRGASAGDLVLATISRRANGTLKAVVSEVFGPSTSLRARYRCEQFHGGLGFGFSAASLHEAEMLATKPIHELAEPQTKDLRTKNIFTLTSDGELPTKAYSFEKNENGYVIGVYYADATLFAKDGSELDEDLFARFAGAEMPSGSFRLLPEVLRKKLAFKLGEDKPAFAIMLQIDTNGNCTGISFENALINVLINGQADEISELFSNIDKSKTVALRTKYSAILDEVWMMFDLCALLSKNKTYEFCQLRDINKKKYIFDKNEVDGVDYQMPNDMTMMLNIIDTLVGVCLGTYAESNGLPFFYETQQPPSYAALSMMPKLNTPLVVDETTICRLLYMYNFVIANKSDKTIRAASTIMQRILPEVQISTTPGMHFSLDCINFVRLSNPCENYVELAIIKILKAHLKGASEDELAQIQQRAYISMKISEQRQKDALVKLNQIINDNLAAKNGDGTLNAMVSMIYPDGIEVMLPNEAYGFIPMSHIPGGVFSRQGCVVETSSGTISFGDKVKVIATKDNLPYFKDDVQIDAIYRLLK